AGRLRPKAQPSEDDDAAGVPALRQVLERLRRFVDRVGPGDALVELQAPALVEDDQPGEVLAGAGRVEIAPGEGLLLEGERCRAHGRLVRERRDADDDGGAALGEAAVGLLGDLAMAHALEGVVDAAL